MLTVDCAADPGPHHTHGWALWLGLPFATLFIAPAAVWAATNLPWQAAMLTVVGLHLTPVTAMYFTPLGMFSFAVCGVLALCCATAISSFRQGPTESSLVDSDHNRDID